MILKGFQEYLSAITRQVSIHGKHNLICIDNYKTLTFGIATPSGEFEVKLSSVKAYFNTGEWRINTSLIEGYKKLGGQTPLVAYTRLPPNDVLVAKITLATVEAVNNGMKIFELRQALH